MESVTEAELVQALSNKVSLITNRVVGAEGLARRRRQDGSVAPPAASMPRLEAAGLSKALTLQLLDRLKLAASLSAMKAMSMTLIRLLEDLEDAGLQALYRETSLEASPDQ